MSKTKRIPSYRHHRPSGQAVVTLGGKDHYLGLHDTPASRAKYGRLISEWEAHGRALPISTESDITINELLDQYLEWAESYYVKNGKQTSQIGVIKVSIRPLRHLYGDMVASDFAPAHLETVRGEMLRHRLKPKPELGLCRSGINGRIKSLIAVFVWASASSLVASSVYQSLKAWQHVFGLKKGRCDVRETKPVGTVSDAYVDAIRSYVAAPVWAMIDVQRNTGMRPGEVTIMRTCDINRSGKVWEYVPMSHKTEHHNRARTISIGPRAQAVLKTWLRPNEPDAFLFVPHQGRPMPNPKNAPRKRQKPRGQGHYSPCSYNRAITRGIQNANSERSLKKLPAIPHWHAHQLRHNLATRLDRAFGREVTRVVLGHASPIVTDRYVDEDLQKAREAMAKLG